MYEIIFLPIAKQDITDIILYISDQLNAPKAAMDLLEALEYSISLLRDFPLCTQDIPPYKAFGRRLSNVDCEKLCCFLRCSGRGENS